MASPHKTPPNRLRELREEHGELQIDIAVLVRRDQGVVARYEQGKTRIPLDALKVLCKHFGVSAEYLLGWDRDENGDKVAA